jgi:DNA repair protein RecN (Recombination protein N)
VIEEISIRNLGVIGEARLPLGPGFTAITGETGAGKTMVVSALGLLLGERSDASAIRSGAPQGVVEGRWQVEPDGAVASRVRDAGGDMDGGELLLSRSVSSEGRSRAVVGGRAVPAALLTELGEHLVVVHGQSDQVRLRSATAQHEALDRFAGSGLQKVLGDYQSAFSMWQSTQGELDVLVAEYERRSREADELRIAIMEIEAAAPQRGEDVELAERAEKLSNLEDLRIAAAQAHEALSAQVAIDAPDVLVLLDSARRSIDRVAMHDPALPPIAESIAAATELVSDITAQLSRYLGSLDADGGRELETVQDRRAELTALVRKYGPSLDEVVDYLDSGSARLLELENDNDRIEKLTQAVSAHRARLVEVGGHLSDIRRAAAARLGDDVSAELAALAMPDARLIVQVDDRDDYSMLGKDQVSFLLAAHPGAEPRPLGKGASGGELSRIMLAIEVVVAANNPVPTFVFDEVDSGVGGASAIEIGRRLAQLSQTAQVIAVTHLAQVAAFATNHLRVLKDVDGEVTTSSVQKLDGDARVSEMARLLSGLADSESGLAHARELLDVAHFSS